ncbi:Histone deacetylase interacting domain-containing protein [Hirschfeldia incana]|nr:Histone deacetylase interacting domain-containing protein [Hirschfeldia incana]
MKLRRDSVNASGSPLASSPVKSYVQAPNPGGGMNYKTKLNMALSYLKDVKEKGKFLEFSEILADYKAQRVDKYYVIAQVEELFKGHDHLIYGFNIFVVERSKIILYEEEAAAAKTLLTLRYVGGSIGDGGGTINYQKKLTNDDASSYLKDVKDELLYQREICHKFFESLKDFEAQRIDISCLIARVAELFKGHDNLISGFNTFLPRGLEINLFEDEDDDEEAPPDESLAFVNKIKKRFEHDEDVYNSFVEIFNMYRNRDKRLIEFYFEVWKLLKDHRDLLGEFVMYFYKSRTPALFNRDQAQRVDDSPLVPQMDSQPDRDVASIGHCDHSVDCSGLNVDTAMVIEPRKLVEKESRERRSRDLDGDGEAEELGDLHHSPKTRKSSTRSECSGLNVDTAMVIEPRKLVEKESRERRSRDLDGDGEAEELGDLHHSPKKRKSSTRSESFVAYSGPAASNYENNNLKQSLSNEKHLSRPRKGDEKEREAAKEEERSKRDKYMGKSIQELDLSDCVLCTPSYRLLPSDYPRHKSGAAVLNDHWVCVNPGHSFKYRCINKYEECLFKCEDDRFELDILLESAGSAANRGEELLNSINEKIISLEEGSFVVEDHFTVLNLRCIERLYGDHGVDVTETIRKNPAAALPVILTRLKQKQDEWKKCREDLNLVWADVYAKYHYKSLDHRSFSFKQQDSKYLSAKALVSEIKDLKEKSRKELNIPHLEYEYLDRSIHEDVFKLVQFSCDEIYSNKEKMGKVLRLWEKLLELVLGVQPRGSDSVEHHGASTTSGDEASKDVTNRIFYGNVDFYVLFRLHRILYERISCAKAYCTGGGEMNRRNRKDTGSTDPYARFMSAVFSLLNGSVENYEFEDECRDIIGSQSYVLFTLDKLLYILVKQLQAVVADDKDNKLLQLYECERFDTAYYENARKLLRDENMYRLEYSSSPPRLSIQLIDSMNKKARSFRGPRVCK